MKRTLVIGASLKPDRYSNMVIKRLRSKAHPVLAWGRNAGHIEDVAIQNMPEESDLPEDVHTISLYIRSELQQAYKDIILKLRPERLIFNPGTENEGLMEEMRAEGIDAFEACTLVMLTTDQF